MSLIRYDDMDDMFGCIDRRMDRMMNNMMNNMFSSDPFGFNMMSPITTFSRYNSMMPSHRFGHNMFDMMNGMNGMTGMNDMNGVSGVSGGDSSYYCSSSVMSMSTDATGRPQIYEASSSTRAAPGGIRETRNSMRDSMSGVQSLSIGHHIRDRGHVLERSRNYYTGQEEENDEYINIEETDAPQFNEEWRSGMSNAYAGSRHSRHPQLSLTDRHNTQSRSVPPQLALPAPPPPTTQPQPQSSNVTQNMQRNKMSQKKQKDKKNKNKPYKKA